MTFMPEFEGKNVAAAVEQASSELNIDASQLEYEVLTAGSSGIFGLVGVKNARIRVSNVNTEGKRPKAASALDQDRQDIQDLLDETFAEPAKKDKKKSKPRRKPSKKQAPKPKTASSPKPQKETKPPKPAAEKNNAKNSAVQKDVPEKPAETKQVELSEEAVEAGTVVLQEIVDLISSESTVAVEKNNSSVLFEVNGGNSAVLIGKHGKTLKAIQHIVEKVVRKACGEAVTVRVDVEKYLKKREDSLCALAEKLAEKTSKTGKASTINRIDAYERKIVHDALRRDRRVRTRSVGSGELRNIVIHTGQRGKKKKKA